MYSLLIVCPEVEQHVLVFFPKHPRLHNYRLSVFMYSIHIVLSYPNAILKTMSTE